MTTTNGDPGSPPTNNLASRTERRGEPAAVYRSSQGARPMSTKSETSCPNLKAQVHGLTGRSQESAETCRAKIAPRPNETLRLRGRKRVRGRMHDRRREPTKMISVPHAMVLYCGACVHHGHCAHPTPLSMVFSSLLSTLTWSFSESYLAFLLNSWINLKCTVEMGRTTSAEPSQSTSEVIFSSPAADHC